MPLVTEQSKLDAFCDTLKDKPFITVDTEFLREKTYHPKLCLLQVGDPEGNAKAIDPLAEGLDLTPLLDLLFDKNILKVVHAGRQDLEIFYRLTGKVVEPFFDTQIAAMVCGYGDSVGYESLVRNITGQSLDKSSQFTDWSRRPLSEKQINYALGDVTHLVKIYEHLAGELEKRGRTSWLYQEEEILADPATYENPPLEAWRRIKIKTPKPKTLAILRELAAWRETRAQEKDIPRTWVMRDETLADMAAQAPKSPEKLKKIRNMSAELADGHVGKTLIEIIEKTENSDSKNWPRPEKKPPLPRHASAALDILRMLLKLQCTEHDVAAKLVASKDDLEALATESKPDIPAMKGWRYEVFGRHAVALKNGELSIGLKNNKIQKYGVDTYTQGYKDKK